MDHHFAIGSVVLVIATATRVMRRSNSRAAAILLGTLVAPITIVTGAAIERLFTPAGSLRTGGGFAIGVTVIFLPGFMIVVGAAIPATIVFAMKERDPEDTYVRNLEDQLREGR